MPFGCGRPYLQGAPLVGFLWRLCENAPVRRKLPTSKNLAAFRALARRFRLPLHADLFLADLCAVFGVISRLFYAFNASTSFGTPMIAITCIIL